MTYNIRYLAIYQGSLKVCNVSISFKILNFTPEAQLSIALYYHVSIECSIMV